MISHTLIGQQKNVPNIQKELRILDLLSLILIFCFSRTQEDFMKYIKRSINRYRKDVFTKVHKVCSVVLAFLK